MHLYCSPLPEKTVDFDRKSTVFSTKSVLRRNKSAMQMKSLSDEILLRKDIRTDLISSKLVWISSWAKRTISFEVKISLWFCFDRKKDYSSEWSFFNEINPSDLWNALCAWNIAMQCEIRLRRVIKDLFHFTWCKASNFTISVRNYFTSTKLIFH